MSLINFPYLYSYSFLLLRQLKDIDSFDFCFHLLIKGVFLTPSREWSTGLESKPRKSIAQFHINQNNL